MERGKAGIKGLAAALVLFLAASCYSPDNFVGEVVIDRSGNFIITYVGDLIWVPLYRDIQEGRIDSAQVPDRIDNIRTDLGRDRNFREIESKGDGVFRVAYKRTGRIVGTGQVTFVRRDNPLIAIRTTPDENTTVSGISLTSARLEQARAANLRVRGILRVITDAPIIETNAPSVRDNDKGAGRIYEWRINGFEPPAPRLTLRIDFEDFQTPELRN